jgi:hypothetical protein
MRALELSAIVERAQHAHAWRRRWGAVGEVALVVLALALTAWLTINVWHTGDYDVFEYRDYAKAFWLDQPRFSAFPTEYPPLALLPFSLTLLPGFADARVSFGLGLSALFLAGYAAMWRLVSRAAARRYAWYLLPALQSTLLARYDLVPALAVLAALLAARGHRFPLAYALLAVGILLKLFPVVLLPALVVAQVRAAGASDAAAGAGVLGRGRALWAAWARLRPALAGAALCVGLCAVGFLAPLLRNPSGAHAFLGYATDRPIQVESFPATLLWLSTFAGFAATHAYSFGSDTYLGALSGGVSLVLSVAMVVGCFAVYALQLAGRLSTERAFVACIALVLLGSKVFSTQYVTWVLPLAAVAGGDTLVTLVWLAICALTFLDYPMLYPFNQPSYTPFDERLFMALVAVRNALLLLVSGRALLGFGRDPALDLALKRARTADVVPAAAPETVIVAVARES